MRISPVFIILCILSALTVLIPSPVSADASGARLRNTIETLSSFDSRSTGSQGYHKSVDFIKNTLESLDFEPHSYSYELPIRRFLGAHLTFKNQQFSLSPLTYNAISPGATDGTIEAPVYYVGKGHLIELDGKKIKGSIVLLDFESGRNWQILASLGAKAAIYLQKPNSQGKIFFTEKEELTPLQFPCFVMKYEKAEEIFGPLTDQSSPVAEAVALTSRCVWEKTLAENIYTVIEGSDPELKQQLLIVEAFFDNQEFVANNSPGADAVSSIATFLELAESFKKTPPKRSILLLATSGQAQTLAGMRDAIWSLNARSKDLRDSKKTLSQELSRQQETLELLESLTFPLTKDSERDKRISQSIRQSINSTVDTISRQLIQLRMDDAGEAKKEIIAETASQRFLYRRLGWAESFHDLPEAELDLLQQIVPQAIEQSERSIDDIQRQEQSLASPVNFRNILFSFKYYISKKITIMSMINKKL